MLFVGMHQIIRPFFISGIRPDNGYCKPDIRLSKQLDIRSDIRPKMQIRNYI